LRLCEIALDRNVDYVVCGNRGLSGLKKVSFIDLLLLLSLSFFPQKKKKKRQKKEKKNKNKQICLNSKQDKNTKSNTKQTSSWDQSAGICWIILQHLLLWSNEPSEENSKFLLKIQTLQDIFFLATHFFSLVFFFFFFLVDPLRSSLAVFAVQRAGLTVQVGLENKDKKHQH